MADQLTPTQVESVKNWVLALESGKYRELPIGNRSPFYEDGCFCALGLARHVFAPGIPVTKQHIEYNYFGEETEPYWRLSGDLRDAVMDLFVQGTSFKDCAAFIREWIFENYHVDLDDLSTTAPSESQVKHA